MLFVTRIKANIETNYIPSFSRILMPPDSIIILGLARGGGGGGVGGGGELEKGGHQAIPAPPRPVAT